MKGQRKTKAQLIKELEALRQQVADLQAVTSEHQQSEEGLCQSEERYRDLFENANDALATFTLDGTLTAVNRGLEVLTGWSREDLIGQDYRKITPLAVIALTEERTRRALVGEKLPSTFEAGFVCKDGRVVPVEARTRFIRDKEGRPIGLQTTARDITARKQAEEALRQSEEKFRAQYHVIPVPTYTWQRVGDDFVLIDYNDAAVAITNGSISKLVGKKASEIYKDVPEIREEFTRCYTEKTLIKREMPYRFSQREVKRFAVSYAFVLPDLVMVHTEDITERKRAEEALRESEEQYRNLFENANDAIVSFTLDGILTTVNRGTEVLLGWSREEQIGRHYREFLTSSSLALTEERARRIKVGEKISSIYEVDLVRKDGSVVPVEARSRFIRDREGKPIGILAIHRDITERKCMALELREKEERLRAVISGAPIILWALDREGVITLSEGKGLDALRRESRQSVGRSIFDVYRDVPQILADNRRALAGEEFTSTVEVAGSVFESRYAPQRNQNGEVIGVIGVSTDITERRRAEEALRESEERYRNLFENANDAIAVVDLNRTVVSINRALERLLGWSREELIGQNNYKVLTPAGIALSEERERRIQNGERVPSIFEHEFVRKDGGKVLVEGRTRFIKDKIGKPIGFQGIYRDITERKRTEEALRESERRYRGLVESQQDLIVRVDSQGRFTFVNDAYCKKFAKQREELIGIPFMPLVHEDDRAATLEAMKGLEVPPYRVSLEQRALTVEGWRWIVWEDYAIQDEHGRTMEIQAVGRDITDRREAEEEKQKLQEQLFQARKLEALGTLAGGVAHDFNNILSVVMGFAELVTDDVPEGTVGRRNLEEILKACRRAKTLVQQILAFSRPQQRTSKPIQIQPVVEEVLTFLQASLPETIEVRRHIDKTAGLVAINPTQLQQVLTNLCANATQALGERSGVLEVSLQQIEVEGALARLQKNLKPGPYIRLTVRDTGYGMAPEILKRIFEPFFTTRPVGEGNGLGLAIVHGIVTGHGGAITVESMPGKGTTFHVYLSLYVVKTVLREKISFITLLPQRG